MELCDDDISRKLQRLNKAWLSETMAAAPEDCVAFPMGPDGVP